MGRTTNIDKSTGLASPPMFPCYKGEGLCKQRTVETDEFACSMQVKGCCYRATVLKPPETPKLL